MRWFLKNLTPHPITIGGVTLPVDGPAPRLSVSRQPLGEVAGVPIVRATMGDVVGLPAEQRAVILIVSAMVAEAAPDRWDLAYPGEAIRDSDGRVIGAVGLCAGPGLASRPLSPCASCGAVGGMLDGAGCTVRGCSY